MKKSFFILIILLMIFSIDVYASSGKLRGASIKSCNGVMYGQHSSDNHWHIAEKQEEGYYPIGDAIYSDPCAGSINNNEEPNNTTTTKTTTKNATETQSTTKNQITEEKSTTKSIQTTKKKSTTITTTKKTKSSDNTLKEIIVDDKTIEIKDVMNYDTTKEKVDLKVVTNDEKASYEIKNNNSLSIGKNEILIEVKAEDDSLKSYVININRKVILSSNKNIKIIINDEEIIFDNYKSTIYLTHKDTTIDIDYKLEDEKAKVEIEEIQELKIGDNNFKIKVIAEDGSEEIYDITIHRPSKTEDVISNILGWGIIGGFGYGIYFIFKKGKKLFKK